MIEDNGNEIHGLADAMTSTQPHCVYITARGQWVTLDKDTMSPVSMTPAQARYLASRLRRCAALVEQRRQAASRPANAQNTAKVG